MDNVVKLLGALGADTTIDNQEAFENLVNSANISDKEKALVLAKDTEALQKFLDICPDIVCLVVPAEDDEEESSEEESNDIAVSF